MSVEEEGMRRGEGEMDGIEWRCNCSIRGTCQDSEFKHGFVQKRKHGILDFMLVLDSGFGQLQKDRKSVV